MSQAFFVFSLFHFAIETFFLPFLLDNFDQLPIPFLFNQDSLKKKKREKDDDKMMMDKNNNNNNFLNRSSSFSFSIDSGFHQSITSDRENRQTERYSTYKKYK